VSSIRIVPAVEGDVPVIFSMIRELAEYEKLMDIFVATEDRIRGALFGEDPLAEALLAYDGTVPAGFAIFFRNYSTFLAEAGIYLEDLYVKPELRGKGIGFALLARIAQIATERGCGRVEWGVLNWNQPSIEFYQRLGAVPMDEWTKYRLTGEPLRQLASRSATPSRAADQASQTTASQS
jgi:GNAT superfamily N-acetyltransferase